jgi:putative ABC transport system permease protein
MSSFARDVVFAARTLRKNAGFALTAIITLALGIGATTAIFSVVNTVLLRPLPYDHPERLTIIWGELRTRKVYDWSFAPGDLKDLMDQATLFEGIAGVGTGAAPLIVDGAPPQQIQIARTTPNIFSVLGVRIAQGRGFAPDDGRPQPRPSQQAGAAVGAPPAAGQAAPPVPRLPQIAVLSDEFWRRQYGADRSSDGTFRSAEDGCRSSAFWRRASSCSFRLRQASRDSRTSGSPRDSTSRQTLLGTTPGGLSLAA